MIKLNRKVEYALIALQYMKDQPAGVLTTATEIATHFHLPFDPTARALQQLAQKKILKAEMGPTGGYAIATDLSEVSLFKVAEALLGPIELARCLSSDGCEIENGCPLKSAVHQLTLRLQDFYKAISVAELFDKNFQHTSVLLQNKSQLGPSAHRGISL